MKCRVTLGFLSSQALNPGVRVGGVVVADDAQPHAGVGLGDQLEKGQELDVGVTRVAGVGGDLAGGDLQRGEQAGGAVANVIVGLLLGNALAQRQNRLGPIQRLDLAFLVDADHYRTRRRIQVEPHHVAQLGFQLRVGGKLERLHPVRLDAPLAPDPRHRGERDPQPLRHQPRRPVRHTQMGGRFPLVRQRLRQHRDLVDHRGTSRTRIVVEPVDSRLLIAAPPLEHRRPRRPRSIGDIGIGHPVSGQQHNPSPRRQPRRHRRRPRQRLQPTPITITQFQGSGHIHRSIVSTNQT